VHNWVQISRDNERFSIWNGSFANISISIVNGFVAMYLLDSLHATDSEMGLLNSLPSLVNLFAMLAAAICIRNVRSKKMFCVSATTVSRTFYIWIALVPFLPIHHAAIWVVWLVALTRVPQSFGDLSWQALIGDIIETHRRSAFFSERNRVMTIVGLAATFSTGFILQQFDKQDSLPYQIVFLCTVVFAGLEIWMLIRHDELGFIAQPAMDAPSKTGGALGWHMVKKILADRRFLWVAIALLTFNFAWQMSWPLFNIYQISNAHAPAMWLGLFTVANQLTQILTFRWWGRMAEQHGSGKMMAFAAFGMAVSPVVTIISTNLYYLVFVNVLTGMPVAGTTLLLFTYLLEVCPEKERTAYISCYNVALSLVGFVAPEIGIWLLGNIGMSASMVASTALRVGAGFVLLAVWYFMPRIMASRHTSWMSAKG
jgi:hypothetical protein